MSTMTLPNQPRVFFRGDIEEEEITPPCKSILHKQRSADSLAVAHLLQTQLSPVGPEMGFSSEAALAAAAAEAHAAHAQEQRPASADAPASSPGSPDIDDAAALLSGVHSSNTLDKAADCLLSLAMLSGSPGPSAAATGTGRGRARAPPSSASKRARGLLIGGDDDEFGAPAKKQAGTNAARRRLKMAKQAATKGAAQNASPQADGAHAPPGAPSRPAAAARAKASRSSQNGGLSQRARQRAIAAQNAAAQQHYEQQQQLQSYYASQGMHNNVFTVSGVAYPIRLLSGASLHQLKLLSAAFKLCPYPTPEQIQAVSQRVNLPPEKLSTWFQSRQVRRRMPTLTCIVHDSLEGATTRPAPAPQRDLRSHLRLSTAEPHLPPRCTLSVLLGRRRFMTGCGSSPRCSQPTWPACSMPTSRASPRAARLRSQARR